MITTVLAKTFLSPVKPGTDTWFGLRYNLNLYRGCQHGCIYCDSRSKCYGIKNFSDIEVKDNALELLEREVRSKREKVDDALSKQIEPGAPVSSERFAAIKVLSEAGIYCGILLMPVLPYLTDRPENIMEMVHRAKEAGAKYVLAAMGMTLREGQREYFYGQLDKEFPGLKDKYIRLYGQQYGCNVPNHDELWSVFNSTCRQVSMAQRMEFFTSRKPEQMRLF